MTSSIQWDPVSTAVINLLEPGVNFLSSLDFLGEATHFVKIQALDDKIIPVAESLGMNLTLLKYTLGLFAVYPFAAILLALPGRNLKHLWSFVVGIVLVQWIYGPDWIHSFVSSLVTYLICAIIPSKHAAKVAFLWVMGYMTVSHIYRMYVSYLTGVFDFTGTQMVLTMKLTSFAYNMYDGIYDYKKVFETAHDPKVQKLYDSRKKYAITKLPNPLEFFGYIYCFTCILAGPAFEYTDYLHAIDGSSFKRKDSLDKRSKPSTILPGLMTLLVGIACMVGYLQLSPVYPLKSLYNPEFVASTTFIERFIHLVIAMLVERFKFYFAWKVAEGACILGGFGFEGYDDKGNAIGWKGVENIDIFGFEFATNIQTASRTWNKRTQGWLERYTYQRTNRSLVATYFVSALWHGLYPGFFLMFLTVPLLTEVERLARVKLNPLIIPTEESQRGVIGKLYTFVCWVCFMSTLLYTASVFSMGSLERSLECLKGFHYYGHVICIIAFVLLQILPAAGAKKTKKQE